MKAWHFLPPDGKIADYGGSPHAGTVVTVGQVLTVEPPIVPCQHGLHGSVRLLAALHYATSPLLCRVELSGVIVHDTDKHAASVRRVLAMANVTSVLHEFACEVAEEALLNERAQGREPDARSWAAIETKRRWLRGEASDADLTAARDAADAAARDAAWAASRAASRAAAWHAAWHAAWDAASHAARHASRARDAAWDAAKDAAKHAQNERLTALVLELPEFAEAALLPAESEVCALREMEKQRGY